MPSKPQFVGEKQPLENRVDYVRGVTYKAAVDLHEELNDGSYVLLRANNIQDGELRFDDVQYVDRTKVKQKQLLRRGDILFCASSGSKGLVGKAALVRENMPVTFGAFCCVLRPKENEAEYLAHYFQSQQYRRAIEKVCSGSNINNLKAANFFSLVVPHYDDDSTRIISALFDSIDAQIKHARDQIANLDSLVKSRFVEMFGDPAQNNFHWRMAPLGENAKLINGRAYKQNELLASGKYPVLRVGNFFSNRDWYYSDLELDEKKYCNNGDLLYAWSASFGPKIWDGGKVIYHYHIWKVEVGDAYNKYFLCKLLKYTEKSFLGDTHGIGMLHLTKAGMEEAPFIVPPLDLQDRFVAFVSQVNKSRFVDLRDEGNKCILILEIRKEDLGRTYNFGVEILHCYTDRVGLKRMAEGRKRNNPLQVIASNLLARPDNHTASATNQSVRFNYGAAPDFASTS